MLVEKIIPKIKITNTIEVIFSFIEKLWLNVKKIKKAIKALIALDLSPVRSIDKRKIIKKGDYSFKNAKKISSEQLCLPLYPGLKKSEIRHVVNSLKKIIKRLT